MASTYSGITVTPNDVATWESFNFREACYLTYNGVPGTQTGTAGTTLVADGHWLITQPGTFYQIDTTDGDVVVVIPDATIDNLNATFTFTKPSLCRNTNNVYISSVSGLGVGPNTVYIFDGPGDNVSFISSKYGSGGAVSYRWRQVWHNVVAAGIIDVNRLTGFTSIREAVSSITDVSALKPYEVRIAPGVYIEQNPIIVNPYISIAGTSKNTVSIQPTDPSQPLFVCKNRNHIKDITFQSVTAAAVLDFSEPSWPYGRFIVDNCTFTNCKTWIQCINPDAVASIKISDIDGSGDCDNAINLEATTALASAVGITLDNVQYVPNGGTCKTFIKGQGELLDVNISRLLLNASNGGTIETGLRFYDGVSVDVDSVDFDTVVVGVSGDNLGAAPEFIAQNLIFEDCTEDVHMSHPNMEGFLQGFYSPDHTIVSENFPEIRYASEAPYGIHMIGDLHQKASQSLPDIPITKLVRQGTCLGLVSGGMLTYIPNTLSAQVSAGIGYLLNGDDILIEGSWNNTIFELPSGKLWYIAYDEVGLDFQEDLPDYNHSIKLGAFVTEDTYIDHAIVSPVAMPQQSNNIENALRLGVGPIYVQGSRVSVSTAAKLSVSQGTYYYGSNKVELNGGTNVWFESHYRDGSGFIKEIEPVYTIDNANWDNNTGTLSAVNAGWFAKHALYIVGSGVNEVYAFIYAQNQYSSAAQALTAAGPTAPSFFTNEFVPLAYLTTQQGSSAVTVEDIRPRISGVAATVVGGGGVTTHGELLGLTVDDHAQYLNRTGVRAMNGNLDMGGFDITNVGDIDDFHADKHMPGGIDPLSAAAPVAVGTTNQLGIQPFFALSDHVHAHGDQIVSSLHAIVTPTTHGFMASSDKVHLTTIQSTSANWDDGTLHANIMMGTGLIYGGTLTAGTTSFTVASGLGIVVDNTTVPGSPSYTMVQWNNIPNVPVTYLNINVRSSVMIDNGGNVVQQVTYPSAEDARDYIILGRLLHDNKTTLNGAVSIPRVIYNTALDADDIGISIGSFTIDGNTITANGPNLQLDKSSGHSYRTGANYTTNIKSPNITIDATKTAFNFKYRYRNGSSDFIYGPTLSAVDPNYFDNGTGILSAVPTDYWTIQRVYMFPGSTNIYMTPGQACYMDLANAKLGLATENPAIDPLFIEATLRTYIIVKQGATALNNISQAVFVPTGRFGDITGGSTAGGDVLGPSTSINNSIARFDGTGGKIIKDNTTTFIDDNGQMTIASLGGGLEDKFVIGSSTGMLLSSTYTVSHATNWNNTYTNVSTNSAALIAAQTTVNNTSANWNNAYSTVNSNSAVTWNYQGTDLKALSAGWTNAQSVVNTTSANWNAGYTVTSSNSAKWDSTYTTVNSNSATWASTYQQVTQATYVATAAEADVTGITITTGQTGNYLISLTCEADSGTNTSTGFVILNINGSNVAITQRYYRRGNQANTTSMAIGYVAALTAGQVVKARAQRTAGALTLNNIIMNIIKI